MTIGLERLLRHMAWANQRCIEHIKGLPEESLRAFVIDPEWNVSELLHHIVDSADFYVYRITGEFPQTEGESIAEIESVQDLELLSSQCKAIDEALLGTVTLEDEQIQFENSSGVQVKRWRSTILSQAIHHATEHRAQIAAALDAKGFQRLDLDEMDLWRYEIDKG